MNVQVPVPPTCAGCHKDFGPSEEVCMVFYAGSAWKNGQAELKKGAELYYVKGFHRSCAPEPGSDDPGAIEAQVK